MGKRSGFERVEKDFYPTPLEAIIPLIPHIQNIKTFCEPCYGKGDLACWLTRYYHDWSLVDAYEIQTVEELQLNYPVNYDHTKGIQFGTDVLKITKFKGDAIITNPPWTRTKQNPILHQMIEHFRQQKPTWLLFDADWMHTKQAIPYLRYCQKIVSVGRVKWIPDSRHTGKDNCAWYLFGKEETETIFYGRT